MSITVINVLINSQNSLKHNIFYLDIFTFGDLILQIKILVNILCWSN